MLLKIAKCAFENGNRSTVNKFQLNLDIPEGTLRVCYCFLLTLAEVVFLKYYSFSNSSKETSSREDLLEEQHL